VSHLYLLALLVSLAGVATLDRKYKLALFRLPKAALATMAVPYLTLLVWDVVGIAKGIFYEGESSLISKGWELGPNFPLEELFFLALLCYTTLVVVAAFGRRK